MDEHNFEFLKTEQYDVWMWFDRKDIVQWFEDSEFKDVSVNCVGSNADSKCGCNKASISIFVAFGEKS